jgi:peptidyl-prolyl cis-trans isomerase B (cyclophilin B)
VEAGMDTVYAIEGVKKGAQDKPVEDVVIESITIL